MADYVDPLSVTRTLGPGNLAVDPASLAVSPAKFDPTNPLGLSAAAPGYLPADQRPAQRDPDLGWSEGMSPGQIIATPDQLPVDLRNQVNQAQIDWGNMDSDWAKTQLQSPTPLILGALGAIAAPFALSALGVGGAAGAAGGAGATGATGATAAGLAGGAGALGAGAAGAGATVSELVVAGAAQGLSIPAIAASIGIPAATVGSILSSSGGSNALTGNAGADTVPASATVPEIAVQAPAASSTALPIAAAGAAGLGALAASGGGGGTPFDPNSLSEANTVAAPVAPAAPTTPPDLMSAIKSGDPSQIGDWIAANPLKAAQLGLLSASALATVAGVASGGSSGSSSGGYTPVALPASFSATSPHFALAGRGDPRTMPAQDWTKYGQGPEQSFFTGVTQPAPITDLTVKKPLHFAHGGFAVRGAGDGRSDSIDARLSDGEYVMDAETVALLGNGSNKAGADKLDQFRVNLRKDKGRNLARGDFSVSAKAPADYMGAR